ncbi:MAG: YdbH domain-containing protein [Deltaproteobacteria bacterium]|nr:YdbH domain-containing protein [Deltaproteobacteria bacterium]
MRRLALFLITLALAFLVVMEGLLPWYLEKRFLPRWAEENGWPGFRCEVRRIGLFGADLGQLALGVDSGRSALRCSSVRLSYSPWGLLNQTVEAIHVGGLSLDLVRDERGWMVPGRPRPAVSDGGREAARFPLRIRRLSVASSHIQFVQPESRFHLPFELQAAMPDFHRITGRLILFPFGTAVEFKGAVDLAKASLTAALAPTSLPLRPLAAQLGYPCSLIPAASAECEGSFDMGLFPIAVRRGEMRLAFRHLRLEQGRFAWMGGDPFEIKAVLAGQRGAIDIAPIFFEGPITGGLGIGELRVETVPHPRFSARWNLDLNAERSATAPPQPFLAGDFSGGMAPSGEWFFALDGHRPPRTDPTQALALPFLGEATLGLRAAELTLRGAGGKEGYHLEGGFQLQRLAGTAGDVRYRLQRLVGRGALRGVGQEARGEAECRIENGVFEHRDWTAKCSDALFKTDFHLDPGRNWRGRGAMRLTAAVLETGGDGIAAEGISVLLPWSQPFSGESGAGHLRVGKITQGGRRLGRIEGVLRQGRDGFSWHGEWREMLVPKLTLRFDGALNSAVTEGRLGFSVARRDADLNPLLAAYVPALKTMEVRSDLDLKGQFRFSSAGISGTAGLALEKLRFHDPEWKLDGRNVSLRLDFSDLADLRSGPGQALAFDRISLGDVVFEGGRLLFQIEPGPQLLVEKTDFGWCGGKVQSDSFRFRPGIQELELALSCDRVHLAQVLEQLGAARAEGGGTLNGRIPVRYRNGQWTFDDGFLYSSPGEGGTIQVAGMENLTAGLPEEGAFDHVRLAQAALQDYEYRWARLGIHSEREDLLVTLSLDGKPTGTLPFVYRRELGGFVRAGAGSPGSNFEGIRLDLNFRFPLERLMRYKKLWKVFE